MKKTILEIYALVVCLLALICLVTALGIAGWNTIGLISPDFTLNRYAWESHQSDESYKQSLIKQHQYSRDSQTYSPPAGEELFIQRKQSYAQVIRIEQRDSLQWLVQSFIIILIVLAVFIVHWKLAAKARNNQPNLSFKRDA